MKRRTLFKLAAGIAGITVAAKAKIPARRNVPTEDFPYDWLARYVDKPEYRALVVRQGFIDADEWARAAKPLYDLSACYSNHDRIFTFPSGARIYIATKHDNPDRYRGCEFQSMFIDCEVGERWRTALLYSWRTHNQGYLPARLLLGDGLDIYCRFLGQHSHRKPFVQGTVSGNRYWEFT